MPPDAIATPAARIPRPTPRAPMGARPGQAGMPHPGASPRAAVPQLPERPP
ncbi:hypothetical protein BGCPKDLD_0732 [Methylorubrum suomiense]|uniref:Uncharacterized protein n=1 Tax=Methylorubrum suomiense TaxID=144191 RepID=A0ABQ4UPA5_9HYPH|nr:hypothetical protein BGCPKDLD_0732 [Methylorubrum suomiense]